MRENIFGRNIAWGAAEGISAVALIEDLGKAEVAELYIAIVIDENILGLKIPVNYISLMQVFQREGDASHVKAGEVLLHALKSSLFKLVRSL
jgi:hypothetical protein